MILFVVCSLLAAAGLLGSLYWSSKCLHPYVTLCSFMFTTAVVQQVLAVATINLQIVQLPKEYALYWFVLSFQLITKPALATWLQVFYWSGKVKLSMKLLLTVAWFLVMYGLHVLLVRFGVVYINIPHLSYLLVLWCFLLVLTTLFTAVVRNVMAKGVAQA